MATARASTRSSGTSWCRFRGGSASDLGIYWHSLAVSELAATLRFLPSDRQRQLHFEAHLRLRVAAETAAAKGMLSGFPPRKQLPFPCKLQ